MNLLIERFGSDEWAHVVQALLHTLWIGAVAVTGLFIALRRTVHPEKRYRWCFAAMLIVVLGGLVAWGVLQEQAKRKVVSSPADSAISVAAPENHTESSSSLAIRLVPVVPVNPENPTRTASTFIRWTPWFALIWLMGLLLMLFRTAVGIVGAERIRRSGQPVTDPTILKLLEEARTQLNLFRRVRIVVVQRLASPAVMGVFIPTLLVPMSLVTSMPMQQLHFILLHELAHVRRGDYLANLFQIVVESILFFNPAIWWISRQMRQEREACCDAMAVELSGGRVEYAETLAKVAEGLLVTTPATMPAFGERKSSSLVDRVKRILVPGYRPGMRLTWRALFGTLLVGGVLLVLSAVGTRITVSVAAELLSPSQRIERIESKMVERGTQLEADPDRGEQIHVRGTIQTEDGSPVPPRLQASFLVVRKESHSFHGTSDKGGGVFTHKVSRGDLYFSTSSQGYAPAMVGPVDTRKMTEVPELNIVLKRGFPVSFHLSDIETGQPVQGAVLKCQFWYPNLRSTDFRVEQLTTDSQGLARLENCASYPLSVHVEAPGFERTSTQFESVQPGAEFEIQIQKTLPVRGVVLDQVSGNPLAGAGVFVIYAAGPQKAGQASLYPYGNFHPWNPGTPVARTDEKGRFTLDSLAAGRRYTLVVDAPGRRQAMVDDVVVGQEDLRIALKPEVIVRGRIIGDMEQIPRNGSNAPYVSVNVESRKRTGEQVFSHSDSLPVEIDDGVARFTVTNRFDSTLSVRVGRHKFEYPSNAGDQWETEIPSSEPFARREVILRFVHSSGVPPKGTVRATVREEDSEYLRSREIPIENGEARVVARLDHLSYGPARTIGYWFKGASGLKIPEGEGPYVIEVPVIPAGAIYASAQNADGSPVQQVSWQVIELKKAPQSGNDHFQTEMQDGVASALPLGGTYQIRAAREYLVCLSEPITLTEERPDREVQMQFPPAREIVGQVLAPDSSPLRSASVALGWHYRNTGFSRSPGVGTDAQGRFHFPEASPNMGEYRLTIRHPGLRTLIVPVDFSKLPITVKMKPGLLLTGQVVEHKSGLPVPNAPVRVYSSAPNIPHEEVTADSQGHFMFDTLHDTEYAIHITGANVQNDQPRKHKPAGEPVTVRVSLYD